MEEIPAPRYAPSEDMPKALPNCPPTCWGWRSGRGSPTTPSSSATVIHPQGRNAELRMEFPSHYSAVPPNTTHSYFYGLFPSHALQNKLSPQLRSPVQPLLLNIAHITHFFLLKEPVVESELPVLLSPCSLRREAGEGRSR